MARPSALPATASPSAVHTLGALLKPRSIAVVGVRGGTFDPAERTSMARRFLENLCSGGYTGKVYPVNPHYESVGDLRCYPSLVDIPGPVDAVLLIVPKTRMKAALADCGAKGVKAVTIISSGYAESGLEGQADERELVALARSHGIRVLGPNCFGYYNSHDRVNLFGSASLLTRPLLSGSIGFVTQSGAVAASMVDRAHERGIGFSSLITTGNQADIHNVECLEHLVDDPRTRVLTMFAEGIGHAERFRAVVRRAAGLHKPCLVVKTGVSEIARQAALAHTGSLVGDDAVYDAVFRQDGVVRCEEPEDLFLTATLLANHSEPGSADSARVAVISMSGAMGGILADGAARYGVALAEPGVDTRAALRAIPGIGGGLNPLDAAMATWANDFGVVGRLAGILAEDPGVDVVLLALSGLPYAERLVDDCAATVRKAGKVFVPMWAGDRIDMGAAVVRLAGEGVAVYETCRSALVAVRALAEYRAHQARIRDDPAVAEPVQADRTRIDKARAMLAGAGAMLTEHESKQLLALYGIAIAHEAIATSAAAAVEIAERIGYPVVLKINSRDIPHKTEAAGLELDLRDAPAVRDAFDAILARAHAYDADAKLEGVLVAPMARPGIEAVAGAYQDAQFGPMLLVGLGGVFIEVLRDTAIRPAPVSAIDVHAMLGELHGRALFDGLRGRGPADQVALAATVVALSTMMMELRDAIAEVDINPLIVHAAGQGVTVADALVVRKREVPG